MLEPWAPISQRLRRKFQTASLPNARAAVLYETVHNLCAFVAHSYLSVSNGSTLVARRAGK